MTSPHILKRKRRSWVSNDFARQYPYLIKQVHRKNQNNSNCTTRQPTIDVLLKVLYPLESGWQSFSDLYTKSQIRFKKSFCGMVSFCLMLDFIERNDGGYQLTGYGTEILALFRK